MSKYCFGVDVGGTTIKMGLFDMEGTVLDKWEIPTKTEDNGSCILPDIAEAVKSKMKEKSLPNRAVSRSANTARFSHRPICSRSTRIFMTKVSAGTTLSNITKTKTLPPHNLQRHTLRISLHTPCKILHPPTSNITPIGFRICTSPLQNLNPSPSEFEA